MPPGRASPRTRSPWSRCCPNDTQLESDPVTPKHKADKSASTYENAVHDYVLPQMKFFETWGRDFEIKFITSSGSDEAAQRADVVTIKAMKPFAVFHLIVAGLDVLETELAKAHIPTMGYSTTATKANLQAPYRWGLSDAQSSAINSAEVIGKQLVGKKAEYARRRRQEHRPASSASSTSRRSSTIDKFKAFFKKFGGTITSENSYPANGSTFGDSAVSGGAGTDDGHADEVRRRHDRHHAERLLDELRPDEGTPRSRSGSRSGSSPARSTPTSGSSRASTPPTSRRTRSGSRSSVPTRSSTRRRRRRELPLSTKTDSLNWYWGVDAGTQAGAVSSNILWLLSGIQAAGPNLTPKTFAQGLFAIPASGGAAQNRTNSFLSGYGKGPGLPYDEYAQNGLDFAPYWWDPNTTGPSNGQGEVGQGRGLVRQRREALQGRHVAEEAVRLVRQGNVRVPLRDPPDARADVRR